MTTLVPMTSPGNDVYYCRAVRCKRNLKTQASLHQHLSCATGPDHRAMQAIISQSEYQSRDRNFDKPHGSTSTETHLPSNSSNAKPATKLNPNAPPFNPSMSHGAAEAPIVYNNPCQGQPQNPHLRKI